MFLRALVGADNGSCQQLEMFEINPPVEIAELAKLTVTHPERKTMAKPKAPKVNNHLKPTHIHVSFTIVTPDQLRKIIFTLSKMSDANNDSWSVMFELDERADANGKFQLVVQLQVDVDHNDAPKADATAKHGLDTDQQAQALAAGDTAKDVKTGDATLDDAKDDSKAVISARNPNSPS